MLLEMHKTEQDTEWISVHAATGLNYCSEGQKGETEPCLHYGKESFVSRFIKKPIRKVGNYPPG